MYINSINYGHVSFCQSAVTANQIRQRNHHVKVVKRRNSEMPISNEKYKQVNSGFKKAEVLDTISRRIEKMPMMMDDAFETVNAYLSGNIPRQLFIKQYQQGMVPLYKRIKCGYNSDEYSSTYKPEISALNKITDVSQKYEVCRISGEQFDSGVENALSEYSNTELDRKREFII